MADKIWDGIGRPPATDSELRTREFLRLVVDGHLWDQAATTARISPLRALRELSKPESRDVLRAVLCDDVEAA